MAVSSIPARGLFATVGAVCALATLTSPATADIQLIWEIDNVEVLNTTVASGTNGVENSGSSELSYTVNGNPDPSNVDALAAWVGGNLNLTNFDTTSHVYSVTVLLDLTSPLASSLIDATLTGEFRGGANGSTYDFSTGAAGYSYLINGSSVFDDWTNLNVTSNGSSDPQTLPAGDLAGAAGSVFPPSGAGPADVNQIGFRFVFEISGGEAAAAVASQVSAAIPGPMTLAPLALGALLGRRRRRQHA